MSIFDFMRRNKPQTLTKVLEENNIVLIEDAFAVVSPKGKPSTKEIGFSIPTGSDPSREYNQELKGREGLIAIDKMRRSDSTVRSSMRAFKTPIWSGRWFMETATSEDIDKEIADLVWRCFTDFMSITFPQVLLDALLCVDYGYFVMEIVYKEIKLDGKRRIVWKKLAPRHPLDIIKWEYDNEGGPKGIVMQGEGSKDISIPIENLVVFVFDKEGGNMEGLPLLRTAYQNWYYKTQLYKIDAIQKERHGIGIPVIKLPIGYTETDVRLAEDLGSNIRTNERAHVVLPPNWELIFAKIEGNPVDAMKSIEHHNGQIRENILAAFLGQDSTGSKEEDHSLFLKSTRFLADMICESFNVYAIPQLVMYNYPDVTKFPKLKVRRIGEQADWRVQSFAIRNYIGAGVIRPDDVIEAHIRNEMDLPLADIETVRVTKTPQNPADSDQANKVQNPGENLPRQAPVPDVSSNNGGQDSSGTSGVK